MKTWEPEVFILDHIEGCTSVKKDSYHPKDLPVSGLSRLAFVIFNKLKWYHRPPPNTSCHLVIHCVVSCAQLGEHYSELLVSVLRWYLSGETINPISGLPILSIII